MCYKVVMDERRKMTTVEMIKIVKKMEISYTMNPSLVGGHIMRVEFPNLDEAVSFAEIVGEPDGFGDDGFSVFLTYKIED